MAAVAERFVLGISAAAEADRRSTSQAESLAFDVVDRETTLDSERAIIAHNDFGLCQVYLLCSDMLFP
jgi:hypothetical protein